MTQTILQKDQVRGSHGGQTWREALLTSNQLVSGVAGGFQQAGVFVLTGIPSDGDTFFLHDDDTALTEQFTWKATATAAFEVQIGGSISASLANLDTQIGIDSAGWTSSVFTNLTSIAVEVLVIQRGLQTDDNEISLFGVMATPAFGQIVDFGQEPDDKDYTDTTLVNLPAAHPGRRNFGIGRSHAELIQQEGHLVRAEDEQWAWDGDANLWNQIGIVLPDFTSGSGGGIKGKGTFDSDKGLQVITPGVAEVKPDTNAGIQLATTGVQAKVDGITMLFNGAGELQSVGGGSGALTADAAVGKFITRTITNPPVTPPINGTTGTDTDTLDHSPLVIMGSRLEFVVPDDYAGGDLTILAVFRMLNGTASPNNQIRFEGQAEVFDVSAGTTTLLSAVGVDLAVPNGTTAIDRSTLFTVPNANVNIGDTVQIFTKRLGNHVNDKATTDTWQVIAYQIRYTSVIANRARTSHIEVTRNTDETPPSAGTLGTDTDTQDFASGADNETKFAFIIPDEWDQITPPNIRCVYAMSTAAGGTVRLATEGEISEVSGALTTLSIVNHDFPAPTDTNPHRSLIVREIDPTALARGDTVTLKLARRTSVAGNSTAIFKLVAVTVTIAQVAQGGFTTVQTEEKYLELGMFSLPSTTDLYGDTQYPSYATDFKTLDRIYATSNGKTMKVVYMGRLAAYHTAIKFIRVSLNSIVVTGPAQYVLRVYAEGSGATPVYQSGAPPGTPQALPVTLTETVLVDTDLSAQPTGDKVYYVEVEVTLNRFDEAFISRPFVRQE